MKNVKVISNGGTGAMLISIEPITGREVIGIGLNEKEEVLLLQKNLNEFIEKNYDKES